MLKNGFCSSVSTRPYLLITMYKVVYINVLHEVLEFKSTKQIYVND